MKNCKEIKQQLIKPYAIGDKVIVVRLGWLGEIVNVNTTFSGIVSYRVKGHNRLGWGFNLAAMHDELVPENQVTEALFGKI